MKALNKRTAYRYGHKVRFNKYKISYLVKIICFVLAVIILPLEIVIRSWMMEQEDQAILDIQKSDSSSLIKLAEVFRVLGDIKFIQGFSFFLYLFSDSLLGFKTALVTQFGIIIVNFLKLLYKVPRPFWVAENIIGRKCVLDFAGPSDHVFLSVFFYTYVIIIFFSKYAEETSKALLACLVAVDVVVVFLIALSGLYVGTTYVFQSFVGLIYGILYTILCIDMDREIHSLSEKAGFIVKDSRKYKFYIFFFCLGVFVVDVIFFNSIIVEWTLPQSWVINARNDCGLEHNFKFRLGADYTFMDSAVIFGIVGMVFGASWATSTLDFLLWFQTSFFKRVTRAVIGVGIAVAIYYGFM